MSFHLFIFINVHNLRKTRELTVFLAVLIILILTALKKLFIDFVDIYSESIFPVFQNKLSVAMHFAQ